MAVHEPYLCPVCKDNRTDFLQIYKLARELRKHPETGVVEYASDEWETPARDGRPDIDIRCRLCNHTAAEREFTRAARRDHARLPRFGSRRA